MRRGARFTRRAGSEPSGASHRADVPVRLPRRVGIRLSAGMTRRLAPPSPTQARQRRRRRHQPPPAQSSHYVWPTTSSGPWIPKVPTELFSALWNSAHPSLTVGARIAKATDVAPAAFCCFR